MAWQLQFPRARFAVDHDAIDIDLDSSPRCTIRDENAEVLMAFDVIPVEATLSTPIHPILCRDAYVRERDLIASYPQQYPWPFGYQVDFRYRSDMPEGIRALELWLSISTSLLESKPKLFLTPRTRCRWHGSNPVTLADHGRAVMMVHPLDQTDCEILPSSEPEQVGQWDVFGGFMEKGVIRRARFLVAWSGSIPAVSTWNRVLELFSDSPLPLTA